MNTEAMRAQFEAWWESTERDVSFPHEAAWASYQAALSSPAVVALVEACQKVVAALDGRVHSRDALAAVEACREARAPFTTGAAQLAKGEEE